MKVVIIGGYGVFGSLTARLLARDGHQLWLAGRTPGKGVTLARELGAQTLKVDIQDAPDALFHASPDVVIDAAGPFQDYGATPYRVPDLCIAHGCHYLDLSDSSVFTGGICELNEKARAAGVFVLSGASSVPGLSSVIVADLMSRLDRADLIDIAILPGNRAPRGLSVIKSIVNGVGRPSRVLRDGVWHTVAGWTDRNVYTLAPDLCRAGYFVDVPDLTLLAETTGAKTIMFRAGLELGIMNAALSALAAVRQWRDVTIPDTMIRALHWLSKRLHPFGSDRGGMQVHVAGLHGGRAVAHTWTLIAEDGDGPFVPGIICRSVLRDPHAIPAGARPCLATLSRQSVESAMSDLAITTRHEESSGDDGRKKKAPRLSARGLIHP